eukprot:gnl/MRDRNA2_/MRDRNA2_133267_c0_seq1.p1 gnl/MRDRNA2_/MRDRNA2_133267_c0~~gnl/MRDRNA2_/MRDRNA2_133267_c0_seq1.p1  ORF type:complete len:434 (-),score=114.17 gnl/MRDRNA2_/MRDRNA2_133267_c0_seq1:119-1420(-)
MASPYAVPKGGAGPYPANWNPMEAPKRDPVSTQERQRAQAALQAQIPQQPTRSTQHRAKAAHGGMVNPNAPAPAVTSSQGYQGRTAQHQASGHRDVAQHQNAGSAVDPTLFPQPRPGAQIQYDDRQRRHAQTAEEQRRAEQWRKSVEEQRLVQQALDESRRLEEQRPQAVHRQQVAEAQHPSQQRQRAADEMHSRSRRNSKEKEDATNSIASFETLHTEANEHGNVNVENGGTFLGGLRHLGDAASQMIGQIGSMQAAAQAQMSPQAQTAIKQMGEENAYLKKNNEQMRKAKKDLERRKDQLEEKNERLDQQCRELRMLMEQVQASSGSQVQHLEIDSLRQQLVAVQGLKYEFFEENQKLREELQVLKQKVSKAEDKDGPVAVCSICMDNLVNLVTLPCRHLAVCQDCGFQEGLKECPLCRTPIETKMQIYMP